MILQFQKKQNKVIFPYTAAVKLVETCHIRDKQRDLEKNRRCAGLNENKKVNKFVS